MPLTQDAAASPSCSHSIILVGLPHKSLLQWDEDALLGRYECWLCRLRARSISGSEDEAGKWRAIPLPYGPGTKRKRDNNVTNEKREHTPSPRSQKRVKQTSEDDNSKDLPLFYEGGTYVRYSGLSLSLSGFSQSMFNFEDCTTTEFYDESVALHRDMDMTLLDEESALNERSITSPATLFRRKKTPLYGLPPPLPGEYTPLNRLPRLFPATDPAIPPTVNLIVGIIAVCPKFRVKTRFGKEMDVIEMLVGDETIGDSEGLRMTFWLEPENDEKGDGEDEQGNRKEREESTSPVGKLLKLRSHTSRTNRRPKNIADILSHYHRGDLVYLQHVALRVYHGKIYAQSLRNNVTKVDLYYRWIYENSRRGESGYGSGSEPGRYTADMLSKAETEGGEYGENLHPHVRKVMAVREWIIGVVGGGGGGGGSVDGMFKNELRDGDQLPPDTQE